MAKINVGEYGQTLKASVGQDISSATSYEMIIAPRHGAAPKTVTATLGTSTVTEDGITYTANQYVEYVTKDGDISASGNWRKRGAAVMSSTSKVVGDYEPFMVLD